jgi:hypothetical protein
VIRVKVSVPKRLQAKVKHSMKRALNALAMVAYDRVTALAQERLTTSAKDFIHAVSTPVVNDRSFVIKLNTRLAAMQEQGRKPFDMKVMLKGRKFVDVPFRHGVPGSTALRPMSKPDYAVMRAAARAQGGSVVRGPKRMPSGIGSSHTGYAHSAARTSSMLRLSKTYRGGSSSTSYLTFRRMSAKSNPASWIHPGFRPLGIFTTVSKEMKKLAPKVIADYVRKGVT